MSFAAFYVSGVLVMWEIGLGTKMFRWRRLLESLEHVTCKQLKFIKPVKVTRVRSFVTMVGFLQNKTFLNDEVQNIGGVLLAQGSMDGIGPP